MLFCNQMNDYFRLNSKLVRAHLDQEDRKISYLVKRLGVSKATVDRMLNDDHVPVAETLKKLAALLGIQESDLLIPKRAA